VVKLTLLVPIGILVTACGGGESNERREPTVGAEIADDYNRQMNRAREVELQLDQQKRDLDAAIEASDPEGR
jgi:hypothetical protein